MNGRVRQEKKTKMNVLFSSTAGQRFYTFTSHGIKSELSSLSELSNVNSLQSYKSACARAASRPTHETQEAINSHCFYATQTTDYSKSFAMPQTPVNDAEDWKVRFKMSTNGSTLANISSLPPQELTLLRPPWLSSTLGSVLIFTIVVDILGNLLVIFSVYRNKKLRNAGKPQGCLVRPPHFCTCIHNSFHNSHIFYLFHKNTTDIAYVFLYVLYLQ